MQLYIMEQLLGKTKKDPRLRKIDGNRVKAEETENSTLGSGIFAVMCANLKRIHSMLNLQWNKRHKIAVPEEDNP
ncbi:hypothetical protein VNO77_34850 [Canavalia gladiata]|uniref:Uncharacterized protein n=1 Tax=Canavalia gladiata TaxID=3824 RepID=A0AAN9KI14_CANGL